MSIAVRVLLGVTLSMIGYVIATVGPEPLVLVAAALGLVCLTFPDEAWNSPWRVR